MLALQSEKNMAANFEIEQDFIAEQNKANAAWLAEDLEYLGKKLGRRGLDVETLIEKARSLKVAVPSWGVGTGGTRFARFPGQGEPRGIFKEGNERVGINTQRYTESEIARVARSAFELARKRNNKVCSMEKANVMESGVLWREEVQKLGDTEYKDVQLSHMYVDNCAMQLVLNPKRFDVVVMAHPAPTLTSE